ncbi:MAG: AAA family ATPase [Gemmatimonadaceae bacterium]
MTRADILPTVRLAALGDCAIHVPRGKIEPTATVVFTTALYLLLERSEATQRKMLESMLWPSAPVATASHRLRQTLLKLKQLGFPVETVSKTSLSVGNAVVSIDFEEFLVSRKGIDRTGDESLVLFPGYEPTFSAPAMEWLDAKKAEINSSITRLMLGIVAGHRVKAQWTEVERTARKLLGISPYNEEATLALAEAYAMRGSKLEGMRILDKYLSEVGRGPSDLRVPATIMRKRIANRIPPRAHLFAASTPLVGRGASMEELGVLLDRARARQGQACLIWGDAGIGKSRLLAEFSTFAALQGVRTQRVQCRASDPHRPLSVFVDMVPLLRGMRGAIGCSPETMSYLDRLTKHKPTPIEVRVEEGDSEFVYARVQMALFDLIDAVAEETPLMLVVEDVHWLDSTSAKVLTDLMAWMVDRRIFFVFTGRERPEQWSPGSAAKLVEIHLPPLEPEPSADVLLGILRQQGREISAVYLKWCVNVAEGNPYFLEELANHWIETGAEHDVPPSLTAMLDQRVSRLTPDALQLLQTCAILEKNSTLERIERVLEYQSHQLLGCINTLGAAGMVVTEAAENPEQGPDRIVSRHDLLSNAAIVLLPAPARAFLHRRVGLVLEAEIDEDRSAAVLWDCAKHWQLSGNAARAFSLATSCATHLMKVGLPSAAAEAYEKCLAFCSNDEERLQILTEQAHAYEDSSAWLNALGTISNAKSILGTIRPQQSKHDDLELINSRARWRSGDARGGLTNCLACVNCESATADHRARAGVMSLMLLDSTGAHDQMPSIFAMIQRLAASTGVDPFSLTEANMVFHSICGDLDIAVQSADSLISNERSKSERNYLFRVLCNGAVVYRTAGLFQKAKESLMEAVVLAEAHVLPRSLFRVLSMLAHSALERGQIGEARAWYSKLLAQVRPQDDVYVALDMGSIGARLALIDRDAAAAAKHYSLSFQHINSDQLGQGRTYGLAVHVAIILARGKRLTQKTVEALENAHVKSRRSPCEAYPAYVTYRALQAVGRVDRAEELIHEYETLYRRERVPAGNHLLESIYVRNVSAHEQRGRSQLSPILSRKRGS